MLDQDTSATYARRRREEEKEAERKKKLATGARFEAKTHSIKARVIATIVMAFFIGLVCTPFTLGFSIVLAVLAVPFIVVYYYGFVKPRAKKRHSHEKFYCPYCKNIFVGMLNKCPNCGGNINVGLYKCENCGVEIAGKKDTCPRCGVGLYY